MKGTIRLLEVKAPLQRIHARTALPGGKPIARNLWGKCPTQTAKSVTSRHVGDCRAVCIQHSFIIIQFPAGAVAASDDEPRRPNHLGSEPPQAAHGARGHIELTSSWWPMCGIVQPPSSPLPALTAGRQEVGAGSTDVQGQAGEGHESYFKSVLNSPCCQEVAELKEALKKDHEPPK